MKYKAPKIIRIFIARLALKLADLKNDFHCRLIKCLNMMAGLFYLKVSGENINFVTLHCFFLNLPFQIATSMLNFEEKLMYE